MIHNKIKIKQIDLMFFLIIISFIINRGTTLGKLIQLIGVCLLLFLQRSKIRFSKYHLFELLFSLYIGCQVIFNIAENNSATLDMFITEIYCIFFSIAFYNYFLCDDSKFKDRLLIYIRASAFALALVLVFNFGSLLKTGRLSNSEIVSIGKFSIVGGNSSTALAMQAMIPALFLLFCKDKISKRNFYILLSFLFLIALLTGTRKVLIGFLLLLIANMTILKKEEGTRKQLLPNIIKAFLITIFVIIVGYFALTKIPYLYENIGQRVINALNYYNSGEVEESSIIVRNRLRNIAISLFYQRPFTGWGMDFFRFSQYTTNGYYSHNNFTELLSGGGLIGLVLYYSKYLYVCHLIVKSSKKDTRHFNKWFVCLSILILMVVLEFWQVTYFYRYIMIYQSILLSMTTICIRHRNNARTPSIDL